tara:strand:+ start:1240 stop:1566 length:327 start_codon:yes stop_codon:yes gene_type:complete
MITVYFVRNGNKIPVEVEEGSTLMEAAKFYSNGTVDEITADCGGACACGTCHVYIEEPWKSILGPIDTNTPEIDLLEYEEDYKEGSSRLSCQIELTNEHEGLIAHLRG